MNLYIDRQGSGPIPLVLLHGWAMHGGVFENLANALRERCTLYIVDLPGHGYSHDSTLPLEPQACAAAIAEATPPAVWVGWSLGGLIAQQAALSLPQVRALGVLCSTPKFSRGADWPYGSEPTLVRQLATDLETDYHATIERFLALEAMGSPDPRGELRHLRSLVFARGEPDLRILQEGIRILDRTDLRGDIPSLSSLPSAWISGRRDRLASSAAMQWTAQQCGGRFTEIEHAGHAPFFGYADAVVAALTPLLESFRE
ncbi:MAG TPA: pimeloyl-ACP methyl ester esterase BioH [Dyella sp.]|uniref:pimeloyl-ACP methyl ester esterase BioH n=1 Tax=Dyella sp. TaxID=1869338 RepID=UPI002F94BBB0